MGVLVNCELDCVRQWMHAFDLHIKSTLAAACLCVAMCAYIAGVKILI